MEDRERSQWNGGVVGRVCGPVVADLHHFDKEQDPDPDPNPDPH
jgi:hypothetical protein